MSFAEQPDDGRVHYEHTLRERTCSSLTFQEQDRTRQRGMKPLLHKKAMVLATIDSVATTKTLRSNLREITTYCATVKRDIELLHSYFDTNYSQIIAHGATVNDPVDILFTAYSVVPCALF